MVKLIIETLIKGMKYVQNQKNKTAKHCPRRCSDIFIINLKNTSHLFLVFLFMTLTEK